MESGGSGFFPFGGNDPEELLGALRDFAERQAESVQDAQREQFATLTLNTAVQPLQRRWVRCVTVRQMRRRSSRRDAFFPKQSRRLRYPPELMHQRPRPWLLIRVAAARPPSRETREGGGAPPPSGGDFQLAAIPH
jgi:hypothetical protein